MMSEIWSAAAELTDVLERENAALRRMDFQAATSLLAAKQSRLLAFQAAGRETAATGAAEASMRNLAEKLRDAAQDNKRLLERAMRAQQHVMSLIAQAARKTSQPTRYGSGGGYVGRAANAAFALSSRA